MPIDLQTADLPALIASPAAGWVTYSLLDASRTIAVHLRHHHLQTSKLLALPESPRA